MWGLGFDVRRGFDLMFWRGGVGIYIGEVGDLLGVGDKKKRGKRKTKQRKGEGLTLLGLGLERRRLAPGARGAQRCWGRLQRSAGWAFGPAGLLFFLNGFARRKTQKRKSKRAPKFLK